jgi:hypothetical protein
MGDESADEYYDIVRKTFASKDDGSITVMLLRKVLMCRKAILCGVKTTTRR